MPGMAANNRGIIRNGNVLGRDGKNPSGFFTWKLGNNSTCSGEKDEAKTGGFGAFQASSYGPSELKSSQISARRTF